MEVDACHVCTQAWTWLIHLACWTRQPQTCRSKAYAKIAHSPPLYPVRENLSLASGVYRLQWSFPTENRSTWKNRQANRALCICSQRASRQFREGLLSKDFEGLWNRMLTEKEEAKLQVHSLLPSSCSFLGQK